MRRLIVLAAALLTAPSLTNDARAENYRECVEGGTLPIDCDERFDRMEWMPTIPGCVSTYEVLKWADADKQQLSWKLLYYNEKCKADGYKYYERQKS